MVHLLISQRRTENKFITFTTGSPVNLKYIEQTEHSHIMHMQFFSDYKLYTVKRVLLLPNI